MRNAGMGGNKSACEPVAQVEKKKEEQIRDREHTPTMMPTLVKGKVARTPATVRRPP
jgi:hypothetical protein